MRPLSLIFLLFMPYFLTGCSQRFQDTNDTLKEAFFGLEDIQISKEQLQELPYASLYARINDGPQIFMVLAFVDINPSGTAPILKWLSADGAMVVTENGRITKTLSLPGSNLAYLNASTVPAVDNPIWQATFDWQPNYRFSQVASVNTQLVNREIIESVLWKEQTSHIREFYYFNDSETTMTSDYWLNKEGKVLKTTQWLIPEELYIELEILKPYAGN